jgi:hypothetical protein
MDQNPIHSSDLNYGVPQLFMDMLDEILEGTQSQDFDDLFRVLMETNNKNIAESTGGVNNTKVFEVDE